MYRTGVARVQPHIRVMKSRYYFFLSSADKTIFVYDRITGHSKRIFFNEPKKLGGTVIQIGDDLYKIIMNDDENW